VVRWLSTLLRCMKVAFLVDASFFQWCIAVASVVPKASKKKIQPTLDNSDEREKPKTREDVEKKKETVVVKEEERMDSSSSDDDAMNEGDDIYGPTVIQLPEKMARDVGDIDTEQNRDECTKISGLFDEQSDGFFLLQIPEKLPIRAPTASEFSNGKGSCSSLHDMSEVKIGKLLLTKKGQVKMKIGNVLFDVSKSISCKERQEFACVDRVGGKLISLGAIHTRLAVTPNISLLLNSEVRQQ